MPHNKDLTEAHAKDLTRKVRGAMLNEVTNRHWDIVMSRSGLSGMLLLFSSFCWRRTVSCDYDSYDMHRDTDIVLSVCYVWLWIFRELRCARLDMIIYLMMSQR